MDWLEGLALKLENRRLRERLARYECDRPTTLESLQRRIHGKPLKRTVTKVELEALVEHLQAELAARDTTIDFLEAEQRELESFIAGELYSNSAQEREAEDELAS